MNIRKSENGFTLLGVLMILVIFSILGASIIVVASSSIKLSDNERDDQSVFYIAEGGATKILSDIENVIDDLARTTISEDDFFNQLEAEVLNQSFKVDSFSNNSSKAIVNIVKLDNENARSYKIVSTGEIGNHNRTLEGSFSVEFKGGKSSIIFPTNLGIYSKNKIIIPNGTVNGNIILGTAMEKGIEISGWPTINGEIYIPNGASNNTVVGPTEWMKQKSPVIEKFNEDFEFPLPPFPVFPEYGKMANAKVDQNGDMDIRLNYNLLLDKNYQFNNINFSSDASLTLNVGNKDISIVVNRIKGGGHLDVQGSGTLTIYIKDNMALSGHVNPNNKNNLFIFIGPSQNPNEPKTFTSSEYGKLNASIYAMDANVQFKGSAKLSGYLITGGKNVEFPGGTSGQSSGIVVYAPSAHIKLTGGGSLTGSVISDKFTMSEGGKIESKFIDLEDNPFFPGESESTNVATLNKLYLREIDN